MSSIQRLIHAKAETYDPNYGSLLHAVAKSDDVPMIDYIMSLGLDTETRDQHGRTPLYSANERVMEKLLQQGASVEAAREMIRFLTGYPFGRFQVGERSYLWYGNGTLIEEQSEREFPFPYGQIDTMVSNDGSIPPSLSKRISPARATTKKDVEAGFNELLLFWDARYARNDKEQSTPIL